MSLAQIKIFSVAAVLAAAALIVPHINSFIILLATRAFAFSILVMSVDLLLGFTGLASLGQAAYLGIGAYLTAILATRYHIGLGYDFWLVLALGMLGGALLSALFGLLAIRASGVYFLMITLALGQCVWGLAYRWNSLTGGDNGINLPERPKFGIDLADEVTFFYVVFALFALSLIVLYTLVHSPFGCSLAGIRERELRMKVLGYNTWLHKYLAFIVAGAFGGLSGVLWAHTAGIVGTDDVVLTTSVDALLMVVLGGAGTLIGGVIGAAVVTFVREYLSTLVHWWQYVLGGIYVLVILYLPGGLMSVPQRLREWRAASAAADKSVAMRSPAGGAAQSEKWRSKGGSDVMTSKLARPTGLLVFAAAASLALPPAPAAAQQELRIGIIAPVTGIFAQVGADMTNGFRMYLEQTNSTFAGTKVVPIIEDSQAKPDLAVTKARKLILQDHVQLIIGGVLATEGYALAPVSTELKTVYVSSVAAADDLTQRQLGKYPYFIRTGWSSSQPNHPFGQWACDKGYKKVVAISADYAFGYESVGGFQKAFEDCGGKIIQKIWPPIGTKDFGPYIPTIKSDTDAVYSLMVGPMALQFPKQLRDSGYTKPILGGTVSYDEAALPFMGDEAIGDVSALQYSAALQTPANEAFVKTFRYKYGKVPSYFSETNYSTAMMIDDVMKQTGGEWPGPEAFLTKLQALHVDTPRGPVSFDDMRNPVQNVYIKKVEKTELFGYTNPELWNIVIKTYPNVSQFWTYGKDAFLNQPVYGRDFPLCKFCE
jgi:branched-chain amino acid transport system substrate-binding protein